VGLGLVMPNMTIATENALLATHRGLGATRLTFFRSLGGLMQLPAAHGVMKAVHRHAIAPVFTGSICLPELPLRDTFAPLHRQPGHDRGQEMASDLESKARRPRRTARREAFLKAAREVFLSQGYTAANVNDVVRLAGGSLATLYAEFGNKEGLFRAMIEDKLQHILQPLQQIVTGEKPIAEGLQRIGEAYLTTILHPDGVALFRVFVGEGRNFPQLMRRFNTRGAEYIRGVTREYIKERIVAGEVRQHDADWTASFFIEMLRAHHLVAALTDPDYAIQESDIRTHVERAVDLLCNGIRPRKDTEKSLNTA
jgi:AcrR family transcriptional regulator